MCTCTCKFFSICPSTCGVGHIRLHLPAKLAQPKKSNEKRLKNKIILPVLLEIYRELERLFSKAIEGLGTI